MKVLLIIVMIIWFLQTKNYQIPSDYIKKFENHMSYIDAGDVDYYIYKDKIIVDTQNYYPVGAPHSYSREVVEYNDLNNLEELDSLIQIQQLLKGKVGNVVYDINR